MYGEAVLLGAIYYVISTAWAWRQNFVKLKRSGLDVVIGRESCIPSLDCVIASY